MLEQGYTATRDIPDCSCMDAAIQICCTDDMIEREPLCARCAHACAECGEPNLEFFKSKEGQPVCYTCAGYWHDDKKIWWNDDEWVPYDAEHQQEEESST